MSGAKPPIPAGTPCPTCGRLFTEQAACRNVDHVAAAATLELGVIVLPSNVTINADGSSTISLPAPAVPVEAPVDIASRPELGATTPARDAEGWTPEGRVVKKALDRLWDAPTPVAHPAPWRWDQEDLPPTEAKWLKDANDDYLLCPNTDENVSFASPRVRALTEAAPMLHTGVVALLHIISEAHHDGFRFPDDVGPICANLRALTDAIDGRERPKGGG